MTATKVAEVQGGKRAPIDKIVFPVQEFMDNQVSGGLLLIFFTVVALVWANSPWSDSYFALWHKTFTIGFEDLRLAKPLHLWINDGLMAIFFFVVGLEIKREVLVGELSSPRQASLPIAAAIGGMVVPALIFSAVNAGTPALRGWGVPMATDIAFAIGALALFGRSVPLAAKIFLTALAIVDDIGAALVIALFYTAEISWTMLGLSAGLLLIMVLLNVAGVRHPLAYVIVGFGVWLTFLKSGVHPTISGVLAAFTIPARTRLDSREFIAAMERYLGRFKAGGKPGTSILTSREQQGAMQKMETACTLAQTPLQNLEHGLHGWVTFLIMPLFALANAGVEIKGSLGYTLGNPVAIGIIVGLVLGKQIGVTAFAYGAVKLGIASLPRGVSWRTIYHLSWLAGIGFTMSLFVASLAFGDDPLLDVAKMAVLTASLIAGTGGALLLARENRRAARAAR